MWGVRYLVAYAIGTVAGVCNEYLQKPHQPCYQNPNFGHILTCGAANVYGWSVLALTAYFDVAGKMGAPTWLTLVCVAPLLTLLEALSGKMSKWVFKEQRWEYPQSYIPAVEGYVSLVSSAYFAVAGVAFFYLMYKPMVSKI
jgi:uncharacterized membrane protein YhdT